MSVDREAHMRSFAEYLATHHIDPIRLSIVAGVRYATVWNASKGKAITQDHAQKIRVALQRLTGAVYTGTLVTLDEIPRDQFPALPIRKIPSNH